MPDRFFQSERKRKRPSSSRGGASRGSARGSSHSRGGASASGPRRARADSVLSAGSSAGSSTGADDLDARRRAEAMDDAAFDEAAETAAEKRVRMAKGYLRKVRDELAAEHAEGEVDAAAMDREIIASRLKQDVDEAEGRIHAHLGPHVTDVQTCFVPLAHIPTSLALTPTTIYVATKRGSIVPVALSTLRPGQAFGQARGPQAAAEPAGHRGDLLAVAASEDGKWVVSGGRDRVVGVWDVRAEPTWVAGIRGHKDAITSIALPPLSNPSAHVLSASLSRHLHLHSLSTLSTLDTFFGHQDAIPSVSALKPAAAVTAGSRDRTARWWKVEEEVQLVLRGGGRTRVAIGPDGQRVDAAPASRAGEREVDGDADMAGEPAKKRPAEQKEFFEGSIDVVCALDDSHFLSGGDSGSISLWSTGKKKPIFTYALAHGLDTDAHNPFAPSSPPFPSPSSPSLASASASASAPASTSAPALARWITSLAHVRTTSLFLSGSHDGRLRLWTLDDALRSFALVRELPVDGFVNAISALAVPADNVPRALGPGGETPSGTVERASAQRSKAPREIVVAAAVAQEPRLGRWIRLKAKNGLLVARIALDAQGSAML
ncbi:pre-rRNA processing protein [Cryptotrichosporon argae]